MEMLGIVSSKSNNSSLLVICRVMRITINGNTGVGGWY
jgi:hypothetical protein